MQNELGGVEKFWFGFDYAQPPGFVNYVLRPLVCAQSPGRKTIFFSPP